jgi:VCBS repeat-containing protein
VDTLGVAVIGNFQTNPPATIAPNGTWPSTYNYFLNATDAINNHVADQLTITALDSQNHQLTVTAFWDQIFP